MVTTDTLKLTTRADSSEIENATRFLRFNLSSVPSVEPADLDLVYRYTISGILDCTGNDI